MTEKRDFNNEFCGSVPLHNINLIQDYGFLLVIGREDRKIIQASENITGLVGVPVQEVAEALLADFIEENSLKEVDTIIDRGITDRIPLSLDLKHSKKRVQAIMHLKAQYFILELENSMEDTERYFSKVFQDLKHSIAVIEKADTLLDVCEAAIGELRHISGFDGVLMYKFDKDWNGSVIAETKDKRLEPYIGQTFPASDIPKQARDLYLKNPYRLIPKREFKPVKLYPVINPSTHTFIDLSDCNLRSVPAVHLEYMKNMDIQASMSIRVIRNEQLWGLISCHNIEPVAVNFETCSIFELLSSVISNKITSVLNKEEFVQSNGLNEKKTALVERIYADDDVIQGILDTEQENTLGLFNATGLAVSLSGRLETLGQVPDNDALDNLLLWLEGKKINAIYSTDSLSALYDDAHDYAAIGSGLLVVPIDGNKGDYLVFFRAEQEETINWGGNPNEALTFEPDGKGYHPRNSFKLWQQKVKNTSAPWEETELALAESLRNFLFEFRTRQVYN